MNKDITKENLKKDLMRLTGKNHQINMNSEHSVSSNNLFKSHLNAKRFNMFLTAAMRSNSASVSVAGVM